MSNRLTVEELQKALETYVYLCGNEPYEEQAFWAENWAIPIINELIEYKNKETENG